MKHNWIRLLSLTLLLTLLAGAVPALAAAKPAIEKPDVFWQGDWQMVVVKNLPKSAVITSVKSSKTSVIEVTEGDEERPWYLHAIKAGSSKITVKYKLKSGTIKSVSATFKVKKYPNAIKFIKLNGKKLDIKPEENVDHQIHGYKKTTTTLQVAANTGWKVDQIFLFLNKGGETVKELDITKKNGKSIKTPKSYDVLQYLILFTSTKTGEMYPSVVSLFRQ